MTYERVVVNSTLDISTHTLRGERDFVPIFFVIHRIISTHTLRGERDLLKFQTDRRRTTFQLTRSVGSVTDFIVRVSGDSMISTHTLRGERDKDFMASKDKYTNFNSHAPWGA